MKDEKHPYYLNEPSHMDRLANRIAGFIGGGIAGLVLGILGVVLAANLGIVPLSIAFLGLLISVIVVAIVGAIWPKWFAWIVDILMFW